MKKLILLVIIFISISFGVKKNVNKTVTELSLRDKIAQMIISHSEGLDADDNSQDYLRLKKLITEEKIGGVIFFKGNALDQAILTNKLQSVSEIPLLISADYERGTGMRLSDGSVFPNNMALGATGNPDFAYRMGHIIGEECKILGVHQNYAPVMDVNNNPNNPIINVRSYGDNSEIVSKMGIAFIRGLQDNGIIATAKHFPGHGDTEIDSHNDLPVLPFDMKRMNSLELIPFKNSIQANVKSIMIAHLSFPELEKDPKLPASLSRAIVNDLLIEELGYNGLIVTDALNMSGVTKNFTVEEIAVKCVEAGNDLILMPVGEKKAIDAIEKAVLNGKISEGRIDLSFNKIINAKKELGLFENKLINTELISGKINTQKSQTLAEEIADASITLVKNYDDALPLKRNSNYFVVSLINTTDKNPSGLFLDGLENKLKNFNSGYKMYEVTDNKTDIDFFINESSDYGNIIIPIFSRVTYKSGTVGIPDSQVRLIKKFKSLNKNVIVISFGNPYLLKGFPEIDSYIAAYGDSPASINAGLKSLFGEINISGKLPVTINEEYKTGYGINLNKIK